MNGRLVSLPPVRSVAVAGAVAAELAGIVFHSSLSHSIPWYQSGGALILGEADPRKRRLAEEGSLQRFYNRGEKNRHRSTRIKVG